MDLTEVLEQERELTVTGIDASTRTTRPGYSVDVVEAVVIASCADTEVTFRVDAEEAKDVRLGDLVKAKFSLMQQTG